MLHEVHLFIAAVHKKVHITLIYVPLCRLCPFCDKKMQFGRRFGKINFILLIYVHKGHGYIAPNSPHTAVMSRFISFTSMLHQQQCADTTSSEPSVREAAAAKAPPHTSASPAAVCSYRYYSFAAAALSSTHLQHHFRISKITYSAGLRRFELHITNGGSPPCGELPFSSILLFLTHSVFL